MTGLVIHRDPSREVQAITLPPPRAGAINIREAELSGGDVAFIDQLQRKHSRMVGWFPTKQIEGDIAKKNVLIAEEQTNTGGTPVPPNTGGTPVPPIPVGYCISSDRYHKHDDCGIVYQLNVMPAKHRGLIGATLIKAVFDRAAYGCKLFCCWCAQDLEANHFWESLGFVPLAFRTGSRGGGTGSRAGSPCHRIHIFWQRRIREGDSETPYWFPSETSGGAVRENRLVLPIPPGTHWSDAKPSVLPVMDTSEVRDRSSEISSSGGERSVRSRVRKAKVKPAPPLPLSVTNGLRFGPLPEAPPPPEGHGQDARATRPKRPRIKQKNDPKHVAMARELRDRYIEQINLAPATLLPPSANGKYDVSRQLEAAPSSIRARGAMMVEPPPGVAMLEAA